MGRKKCNFNQKDYEVLSEYVLDREEHIPSSARGVRTYELECDYHGRISIAATKGSGNPYTMLYNAYFDIVILPLLKNGLLKANHILPQPKSNLKRGE